MINTRVAPASLVEDPICRMETFATERYSQYAHRFAYLATFPTAGALYTTEMTDTLFAPDGGLADSRGARRLSHWVGTTCQKMGAIVD